jgi:hypothetical protein
VHRSDLDPCHHQAIVVNLVICYSPFFFAAAFLGFAGASTEAAVLDFAEADLFKRALIALLFLETPKEPLVRFPFFVFLSPLPMNSLDSIDWQV